jgi:sigma-B regulation protein RsbU (phosphoserine phosphatase)
MLRAILRVSWVRQTLLAMNIISNPLGLFFLAVFPVSETTSNLRWQVTAIAIGAVLLSFGLAGMILFFFRPKISDHSLVFFSLFALLYGIRLIFRQTFFQSLVPVPTKFWNYCDLVIDNFIAVPLTLFLIEIVPTRWRAALRWLLAGQIAFATARFFSQLFEVGRRPMETAYHIVIAAYCALLLGYPFLSAQRGQRIPREVKAVCAGLAIFALFVVHTDLLDLGLIRGRNVEPIGFLILVCCLGYVAALRTYSNEQRLLSIQKELEIARQIQSSILPREVPHLEGLDIAARYVPMAAVAGDFYDFIVVDERRVGIIVADVTGHGVPAALIASMLKSALAAQSAHAADPAKVLSGLNHALCGKFEEHFVTAGYLFVDAEKQILRYAAAGHPPLVFGSIDGGKEPAFREIESNGLLLGISEGVTYFAVEIPFRPGDRCILYTDGVVEAKNGAQKEFGSSRLLRFFETQSNLAASSALAAFLTELARWSERAANETQEDDITLIAVDFLQPSALQSAIPA